MDEAADLVLRYGGSLSGEHGDGQVRASLLPKMYGAELMQAFREFKASWDPQQRQKPGTKNETYPMDEDLRSGPERLPPSFKTQSASPAVSHHFKPPLHPPLGRR